MPRFKKTANAKEKLLGGKEYGSEKFQKKLTNQFKNNESKNYQSPLILRLPGSSIIN